MLELTEIQRREISEWVARGDSLSTIQKNLQDQFQIQMTYMDVRFLVDDLQLDLKDPQPTPPPPKKEPEPEQLPASSADKAMQERMPAAEEQEEMPQSDSAPSVSITVDPVSLNPAAIVSGSVKFSDGVTARWIVDQQGRPGLMDASQPGYRPTQADAQAFMSQLAAALQEKGF